MAAGPPPQLERPRMQPILARLCVGAPCLHPQLGPAPARPQLPSAGGGPVWSLVAQGSSIIAACEDGSLRLFDASGGRGELLHKGRLSVGARARPLRAQGEAPRSGDRRDILGRVAGSALGRPMR